MIYRVVLLGVFCTVATFAPSMADTILTCTFTDGTAMFESTLDKPITATLNTREKPWSVVFSGLDSDRPRFKGNTGEADLIILQRGGPVLWLAEIPPLGGLNLWTIFLERGMATLSKQYDLFGPVGLLSMGRCK
jgi:hypothetical protein